MCPVRRPSLIPNGGRATHAPMCLSQVLARANLAWRAFFRHNSANSNRDSEYSDRSTGLMANAGIEIARARRYDPTRG